MPNPPVNVTKAPEISIKVGGEKLTGWTGFQVVRAIDACADAFAFSLPFAPTPKNIQRFKPYSPGVIEIWGDDERFLTGYFEVVSVNSSADARNIELQGRSTTGVLVDWSAGAIYRAGDYKNTETQFLMQGGVVVRKEGASETQFEFQGLTFNQIAAKIAAPNEVKISPSEIPSDTGPMEDVSIEPGDTVFDFLSKLASANGYFGRATPAGALHYFRTLGTTPAVVDLHEGDAPIKEIQTYHDVTKRFYRYQIIASTTGQPGVAAVSYDEVLSPAIRGTQITEPEQQSADYQQAANLSRSIALIESYTATITVTGFAFRNKSGAWQFWRAGDCLRVYAPGAFVLKPTKLIIKQVTFQLDESGGQQTTLDCALPEVYSGGYPQVVPWQG